VEVIASPHAARGQQGPDTISTPNPQEAVVVVNGATYRGPEEIAHLYATLIRDLPDAVWRTDVAVIHDDVAYVEWACRSAAASVKFGTDTFVVKNGLITRQTASFSIIWDVVRKASLGTSIVVLPCQT
jgi:hypothetical protein